MADSVALTRSVRSGPLLSILRPPVPTSRMKLSVPLWKICRSFPVPSLILPLSSKSTLPVWVASLSVVTASLAIFAVITELEDNCAASIEPAAISEVSTAPPTIFAAVIESFDKLSVLIF